MSAVLSPDRRPHRFSRDQYERMVEAGIFAPEDRLELLDGEIIAIAPQKSRHATAIRLLAEALRRCFDAGHDIRAQLPLALDDRSEPEPDIAVVPGSPRDYRDAHPRNALLVVEVADASLAYDRSRKLAAYARAGVPEYWILDLTGETLEVCRRPMGETYCERRILTPGERITPLAGNGVELGVAEVLP
jgi:Uma2 family endonuclease